MKPNIYFVFDNVALSFIAQGGSPVRYSSKQDAVGDARKYAEMNRGRDYVVMGPDCAVSVPKIEATVKEFN